MMKRCDRQPGATAMKRLRLMGAAFLPALLACGCSSMNNTERGALSGAGLGAVAGGVISKATGHGVGNGALIGGALGGVAGGLTGNAIDESERKQDAKIAAATATMPQGPLGLTDVVQMAQSHVSDNII